VCQNGSHRNDLIWYPALSDFIKLHSQTPETLRRLRRSSAPKIIDIMPCLLKLFKHVTGVRFLRQCRKLKSTRPVENPRLLPRVCPIYFVSQNFDCDFFKCVYIQSAVEAIDNDCTSIVLSISCQCCAVSYTGCRCLSEYLKLHSLHLSVSEVPIPRISSTSAYTDCESLWPGRSPFCGIWSCPEQQRNSTNEVSAFSLRLSRTVFRNICCRPPSPEDSFGVD